MTILSNIQAIVSTDLATDSWVYETDLRAAKIEEFRNALDGDFVFPWLTPRMKRIANVSSGDELSANHLDAVISSMSDRLTMTELTGSIPSATEFSEALLMNNRIDGLQTFIHRAALRDGITFVLAAYDNEAQQVTWTHEPAYNGTEGMLAIWADSNSRRMLCAVKVWLETRERYADTQRLNVYYPDRIERYESLEGGIPNLIDNTPWRDAAGDPLGVPVIAFVNNASTDKPGEGLSELENALPLQKLLNRTHYNLIVASELSAVRVYVAKGFAAPEALYPGMVIEIAPDGMPTGYEADFTAITGDDTSSYLAEAEYFTEQIYAVTKTPRDNASAEASGESLKQREIGLIGKLKRAQINFGNAYEELTKLSALIDRTFNPGSIADITATYNAVWEDTQLRNRKQNIETIRSVSDILGPTITARLVAAEFDLSNDDLDIMLSEQQTTSSLALGGIPDGN